MLKPHQGLRSRQGLKPGPLLKRTQFLFLLIVFAINCSAEAQLGKDILTLQHDWAIANYQLKGKEQDTAFEKLMDSVDIITRRQPDSAEAWAWSGIIRSTYAGVTGGLGALKYVKTAKNDLEKSLEINDKAMEGSAYASLGTLYLKLPGWPISFGDNKKAKKLLKQALAIYPEGIDNNFFYAEYLREVKDYQGAEKYLLKAANIPASPDRPLADVERHKDITLALQQVRKKL